MANNPYATSKQAADSVGITPGDIGVAANDYVRKKELIATNKFDADALASYGNNDYVMLKDIAKGAFQVTLQSIPMLQVEERFKSIMVLRERQRQRK